MFENIQEGKRCYPGWAGLPWLPPGRRAPQIDGQETAGRMRRIPTPWPLRLCPLWQSGLKFCPQYSLFLWGFLFFWPWLLKQLTSGHKRRSVESFGDSKTAAHSGSVLPGCVVSVLVGRDFLSKETKPRENAFVASSYWFFNLFCHCCVT